MKVWVNQKTGTDQLFLDFDGETNISFDKNG